MRLICSLGIAVGAGELLEELAQELADKEDELESVRARVAELEAEVVRLKLGAGNGSRGES